MELFFVDIHLFVFVYICLCSIHFSLSLPEPWSMQWLVHITEEDTAQAEFMANPNLSWTVLIFFLHGVLLFSKTFTQMDTSDWQGWSLAVKHNTTFANQTLVVPEPVLYTITPLEYKCHDGCSRGEFWVLNPCSSLSMKQCTGIHKTRTFFSYVALFRIPPKQVIFHFLLFCYLKDELSIGVNWQKKMC